MAGFDTAAELAGADIGEFLRRFTRAWGLSSGTRVDDPELPALLRLGYERLGFLRPEHYIEDGVRAFHGADPAVTETSWGIRESDRDDDPAVLIDTGDGWRPYANKLSLTLADLAMTEVIQERDYPLANACELPADRVAPVMAAFDRIPLPDLPMWVDVEESPVRWYSRPGQLLRTHGEGGVWLWVAGQTENDLAAIYSAVPGAEWSN